jgi:hypothetical protein
MEFNTTNILGVIHCSERVLEDLVGFNTRYFIEEPSAAGVHEQSMALHFQQTKYMRSLFLA